MTSSFLLRIKDSEFLMTQHLAVLSFVVMINDLKILNFQIHACTILLEIWPLIGPVKLHRLANTVTYWSKDIDINPSKTKHLPIMFPKHTFHTLNSSQSSATHWHNSVMQAWSLALSFSLPSLRSKSDIKLTIICIELIVNAMQYNN